MPPKTHSKSCQTKEVLYVYIDYREIQLVTPFFKKAAFT